MSELIAPLLVMAVWTGWALASALTLARLGFFSAGPLLRAPQRYSQFTLLEPAAIAIMYFGLSIAAAALLYPWITGSSSSPATMATTTTTTAAASSTASAAAPATAASEPATTTAPVTSAPAASAAGSMTPERLARFQLIDSIIKIILVGIMLFLARRMVVDGLPALGLSVRQVLPGFLAGLNALWLMVPWLLATMIFTEILRKLITGTEPAQNPILRALKELKEHPVVWANVVLVLSEAVLAPIAEELFFRGFLQTALLRLGRAREASSPPRRRGFEPVLTDQPATYIIPPAPSSAPVSARWRWATILIVSGVFASVHFQGDNPEVLPIIFVLAIALGYLYERTGNLFACMTLHAAFNTTVTIMNYMGSN